MVSIFALIIILAGIWLNSGGQGRFQGPINMTFRQGEKIVSKRIPARELVRRWWIWLLAAALVGIVAHSQLGKAEKAAGGAARKGANLPPLSVPVKANAAQKGDIGRICVSGALPAPRSINTPSGEKTSKF